MMGKHRGLHMITFILLVIGGLNWGVWALFHWDISQLVGGMGSAVAKLIYILVGLSALYELLAHGKHCRMCKPDGNQAM